MLDVLSMTGVWVASLSLAAFLVLFWALRGAPIGQAAEEDDGEEAPRAGYRDRVVAAAVVGLLLVSIGAYLASAVSIPWSLPLFVVGFGVVITLVMVNRRYRHASPTLRRVVEFSNTALNVSLVAGILIAGNVMAFKYGGRAIDFTSEGAYSLSSQTINTLKHLSRPVTFTVFIAGREASTRVQQTLNLFKAEDPSRISVEVIDPFLEYERFSDLKKDVPDVAVAVEQGGGVVVKYGAGKDADRVVVQGVEMFELPTPGKQAPDRFESNFMGEDALLSALIRLSQGKKPIVAFTTAHDELPPDQLEPSQRGAGLFKARLEAIGSEVEDVNLLSQEIEPETSLVIIAAPQTPFQPEEVARLKSYLNRGGHLLALVGSEGRTGLEELLKSFKIELGTQPIVEPRSHLPGRPFSIFVILGAVRHPIIESLKGRLVVMPRTVPLTVLGMGGESPSGSDASVFAQAIGFTSKQSWAESDPQDRRVTRDEKKDTPGPFPVGVAVVNLKTGSGGSAPEQSPRLVVFSSPEMAENYVIAQFPTNLDLLMNSVHWLRGRPHLQGIAPKRHVSLRLAADLQLQTQLVIVPTVIAVVSIISVGVAIYLSRRA